MRSYDAVSLRYQGANADSFSNLQRVNLHTGCKVVDRDETGVADACRMSTTAREHG